MNSFVKASLIAAMMTAPLMAMKEACELAARVSVCHSGFGRLMNVTDANPVQMRRVWEFLQNEHDLAAMLERLPQTPSVTIGAENSRVELSNCSVISARYTAGDASTGAIAAVAPMRTDYARTFSILECIVKNVGSLIGELVEV